jgi:hypothetical protein
MVFWEFIDFFSKFLPIKPMEDMKATSIAIPAPTLEALLGTRERAHQLLFRAGYDQVVDVAPFFVKTMLSTATEAQASSAARISPACPRAREFFHSMAKPELVAGIPSPAAQALLACIDQRDIDKILSITFISPCPHKAEELKKLPLPSGVELKILPLKELLKGHELEIEAPSRLDQALRLPELGVPFVKLRGEKEALSYFGNESQGKAACVDLQMCPGGCLSGAWCPAPSLSTQPKESDNG